jgi:hypothetical protein
LFPKGFKRKFNPISRAAADNAEHASVAPSAAPPHAQAVPALILQADAINVLIVEPDDAAPRTLGLAELRERYLGHIARIVPKAELADARNQAFVTEYVMGMETVKSLQFELQLNSKYSAYLASYLSGALSGSTTRDTRIVSMEAA